VASRARSTIRACFPLRNEHGSHLPARPRRSPCPSKSRGYQRHLRVERNLLPLGPCWPRPVICKFTAREPLPRSNDQEARAIKGQWMDSISLKNP
jgi:hypothetical protein